MIGACPWRLVKDGLFGPPRRGEGVPPSSLSNLQGQAEWPPWGLGGGVGGGSYTFLDYRLTFARRSGATAMQMFLAWKYNLYVVFPLLTFFACNVRPYFKGFKYQEEWSCLAGSCFGLLCVLITQPVQRMPLLAVCVVATGL